MIERLQRALEHLEELPLEAQEEIAMQIEELTERGQKASVIGAGDEWRPH